MNELISYAEASIRLGRSKRTLRRWVADPENNIRTQRGSDGTLRVNAADLYRVEARKNAYREAPTFGRRPPSAFGSVAEQRARRHGLMGNG